MDFDRQTGPDGFVVRIFVSSHAKAKGLVVKGGTVDILMFDGARQEKMPPSGDPMRAWSFSAAQLKGYATVSSLGVGYQFSLRWGAEKPTQRLITIVARYTTPSGGAIYSAPSIIPVPAK